MLRVDGKMLLVPIKTVFKILKGCNLQFFIFIYILNNINGKNE
jgi:hypothetical protein